MSHNHMAQWKVVKGSERSDVITTYIIHVDLKVNTWSFRVG